MGKGKGEGWGSRAQRRGGIKGRKGRDGGGKGKRWQREWGGHRYIRMYTDPDPLFLAPAQSLETGQEYPVFRHADLATLEERRKGREREERGYRPTAKNFNSWRCRCLHSVCHCTEIQP